MDQSDTYISQLPFEDVFDLAYLGADATSKGADACDDWETFCGSVTSLNGVSRWAAQPGASSPMPRNSASCTTSYSLPPDFSVAEISGPSYIPSSAMERSPTSSCPRFSEDSENGEPAVDLSMY